MRPLFRVLGPGACTTVQDAGRTGFRQFGVPPAGCLDRLAHRVANMLVGNPDNAAVLEMTFKGADFEVLSDADVALTGAEMPLSVNNRSVASWSKVRVHSGDQINIGQTHSGCRAYLAVTGGIDGPEVMGSLATYAAARIGGFNGRALCRGDVIFGRKLELLNDQRHVPPEWIPRYSGQIILRAVPGPQEAYFAEGMQSFFDTVFTVSPQADRKGYRLQGPAVPIKPGMPKSIVSEPCIAGCVQVPEDGQPIILLGEQTVGGYAKIATVISPDLDKIAQALPGDQVCFEAVEIETAYGICRQHQQRIEMLRQKIVYAAPLQRCAKAFWNTDPEMFCRKIQTHLNQMRQIQVMPMTNEMACGFQSGNLSVGMPKSG